MRKYSTTDTILQRWIKNASDKLAKTEFVQYGNTVLKSAYCPRCQRKSFLIEGLLQCCGLPIGDIPAVSIRVVSAAPARRKLPTIENRVRLLEDQDNKCFYCDIAFGTSLFRTATKIVVAKVCWDHYVPYAYSHNNQGSNFVAACQICNGIKSSLMFDTVEDARRYIKKRRDDKGWQQ